MINKVSKYIIPLYLLLIPSPVFAQQLINIIDPASQYNNLYTLRPSQYVRTAILVLLGLAGVTAFIFLLLGGVQWITSGGDKDAAEKARKKISFALVGLAITFSAYAIIFIIRALFGVNLIEFTINNLGS
jgi:hypothetical protein